MKLKTAIKFFIILSFSLTSAVSFAQDQAKEKEDAAKTQAIFEKVLKDYELKKQKEQDELAQKLNGELEEKVNAWLDLAKKDKDEKIGTRLKQNWEKLSTVFKIPPTHYEYYLRGYNYTVVKSEVLKTLSLTTVYKAVALIKEDLYVEKYHSPDVSEPDPYFFTVTTNYVLNYEYKEDNFELVTTDSQIVSFVNDAPMEIKRPKNLI